LNSTSRKPIATAFLVACVFGAVHAAFALLPQVFEPLRDQATDRLFELRNSLELWPAYDERVVHVDIDDPSLQRLGTYYLGRSEHAELVAALGRAGLAAQFHDMIFAAPQGELEDTALAGATAEAGNVYYGIVLAARPAAEAAEPVDVVPGATQLLEEARWHPIVRGDASEFLRASQHFVTIPLLAEPARGIGYLDIRPDRDGVYRRLALLVRDGDGFLPSAALHVACDYLGVPPERVEIEPGRHIVLRGAGRPGAAATHDVSIPIDVHGQMILNYLGPWSRTKHYPAASIFEAGWDRFAMEDLRAELAGKVAVVAWVATGSGDMGSIPGDAMYPLPGLHANAIHNILSSDFLVGWPTWKTALLVELPLVALLWAASLKLSTARFLVVAAAGILVHLAGSGVAFLFANRIVDVPGPLVLLVGTTTVVASFHYHLESRVRAAMRSTLDAYFAPSVVDKIMAHSDSLATAAQKKELTILFSDIKSFTTHTASMEAGHVRRLLNEYFGRMIDIVFDHGGTLDKFIGDGLLVFFGDPEPQPDHATRAVRAAVAMQLAARELRAEWARRGDMPLEIRIGINTGEVIVGNMGSQRKLSYTVLGEPVNLAQRLESNAPPGGILIADRTRELLGDAVPTRRLEPLRVKGIERPVSVHEVPVADRPGRAPSGRDAAPRGSS
jgi:adenylate cyclase